MRLRIGLVLIFSLLLSNGCKKQPAEAVKATDSTTKTNAQTQCVTPLALADVTAKKDLTWNQRSDGTEVTSTVTYGAHSVLAISVEFTGDDLRYRVVSMNHPDAKSDLITAPDGTQCAYSLSGKSLTGYAEIATLCAGEMYQVFLQTCNRNGDCSDETPIAKPYLQDRKRDAGIQAALTGVDQSRQALDAIAEQAYQTIVAYYHAHKDDLNPSPERKQFLDMAQRVENMGLDLYKTVAYTQYGQMQDTLQSNLQLAGASAAAAAPSQAGCAPENQILLPTPPTASALALAGESGTDTNTNSDSSSKTAELAAGITFLSIGAIGAAVGVVIWAQARNQLRDVVKNKTELVEGLVSQNKLLQTQITNSLAERQFVINEMKGKWAVYKASLELVYEAQEVKLQAEIEKYRQRMNIDAAKADLAVHEKFTEVQAKISSLLSIYEEKLTAHHAAQESMVAEATRSGSISPVEQGKVNKVIRSATLAGEEVIQAMTAQKAELRLTYIPFLPVSVLSMQAQVSTHRALPSVLQSFV